MAPDENDAEGINLAMGQENMAWGRVFAPFAAVLLVMSITLVLKLFFSALSLTIGRKIPINQKIVGGGLGGLGCLLAAIVNFIHRFQDDFLGGILIGFIYLGFSYYGYRVVLSGINSSKK